MKEQIEFALAEKPFNPQILLDIYKKDSLLMQYFAAKIRHYSLDQHTLLVMKQFEKYFSKSLLPLNISIFRIFLSLHDIGKAKAFQQGSIHLQHQYSYEIISKISHKLPINKNDELFLCSFVKTDILGNFFQNKISLENTVLEIKKLSNVLSMFNLSNLFYLITIYYQVDAGSYTIDAGGLAYLEKIFKYENGEKVFDYSKNILTFSDMYRDKYSQLENIICYE